MPDKKPSDEFTVPPPSTDDAAVRAPEREAAASIMRQQIDQLYGDETSATQLASPHGSQPQDGQYHQTHSETTDHAASQQAQEQWKQYHTQWQNYYQQYYERYYMSQLASRQQKLAGHQLPARTGASATQPDTDALSKSQAVSELRAQLLDKVREHSTKARKSPHFVPVAAALIVALSFGFLQFNGVIIAYGKAFVSPGSINPTNLIIDPTADTKVSAEPKIIIPKINVEAPVVYDVPSIAESVVQTKLKDGVVHYPIPGANGFPGQKGNTVILGHSSNDVFDDGKYKFVFVQLEKLQKGDTFYLNYQGTRYTYSITEAKVIDPTQISELVLPDDKPRATLVTCTPIGTALKRLIIIGEQISPNPDTAGASQATASTDEKVTIPGDSPTLFERLFGAGN